jgi:hypothetical protein
LTDDTSSVSSLENFDITGELGAMGDAIAGVIAVVRLL